MRRWLRRRFGSRGIGACAVVVVAAVLLGRRVYFALASPKFAAALAVPLSAALLCGLLVEQKTAFIPVGDSHVPSPLVEALHLNAVWASWWFAVLLAATVAGCGVMLFRHRAAFTFKKLGLRSAGLLLAHLSVIFIIAGAAVDHFLGWTGEMRLYPDAKIKSELIISSDGRETRKLPFAIKLLDAGHFTNPGDPCESAQNVGYRIVCVDGENRTEALIRPNEPFVYHRIRFTCQDNLRLHVAQYPGVPLVFGGFAAMVLGLFLSALTRHRTMGRAEAEAAAMEATPDSAGRTLNKIAPACGLVVLALTLTGAILLLPRAASAWSGTGVWFRIFLCALGMAAVLFFAACFVRKSRGAAWACTAATVVALVSGAAFFAQRWAALGHPPMRSEYEIFVLCAWSIMAVYLVVEIALRLRIVGFFAAAAAFFFATLAITKAGTSPEMVPPILDSAWFAPHVLAYLLGYGAIFVGFFVAVLALIISFTRLRRVAQSPGLALAGGTRLVWGGHLDIGACLRRIFAMGFALLTVGLLTGAAWGLTAWGDYWGWDAKEVAALVSWAAMLGLVHLQDVGIRRAAITAIICTAVVALAWLAFEMLPASAASMHSYD